MTFFSQLPKEFCENMLRMWLENKCIGLFDSATSNEEERRSFKLILNLPCFELRWNEENKHFMRWLAHRGICVKEFKLFPFGILNGKYGELNFSKVKIIRTSEYLSPIPLPSFVFLVN